MREQYVGALHRSLPIDTDHCHDLCSCTMQRATVDAPIVRAYGFLVRFKPPNYPNAMLTFSTTNVGSASA